MAAIDILLRPEECASCWLIFKQASDSAIGNDYGTSGFIRLLAGPVALEFQKKLYPACHMQMGLAYAREMIHSG